MIDDLDQVLRQFLIRDLPILNGEVDIEFDQPRREWSARVSRPTLNLFLYDLRENQKLRQAQPTWEMVHNDDGTVTKRRKPVRIDLHYMITAWATEPEDEHRLLSRTLMALFRHPHLPQELLSESLQDQQVPIPITVAQYDELRNPTDVWNVLDNEVRPALVCIITLAIDPYLPIITPLVRARELHIGPSQRPFSQELDHRTGVDPYWTIGGTLRSEQPMDWNVVRLTLVEQGREVPIQAEGRFAIGHLRAGEYTLEISGTGRADRRYRIVVPAADYDLEV